MTYKASAASPHQPQGRAPCRLRPSGTLPWCWEAPAFLPAALPPATATLSPQETHPSSCRTTRQRAGELEARRRSCSVSGSGCKCIFRWYGTGTGALCHPKSEMMWAAWRIGLKILTSLGAPWAIPDHSKFVCGGTSAGYSCSTDTQISCLLPASR